MKAKRMRLKVWSKQEVEFLTENYPTMATRQLAAVMGRDYVSLKNKATKLKIKKAAGSPGKKRVWSEADNELIFKEYPEGDLIALAATLRVGLRVLYQHAAVIGAGRSPEKLLAQNRALGKKLAALDVGQRFKKGMVPLNKGKRQEEFMDAETIERTKATRFKAGGVPPNVKPIGWERTTCDGYIEVKVRNACKNLNFEFKHHIVYKKYNGEILPGYHVEFADGDKTNFDPSNLVLRTRAENIIANTLKDVSILKRFFKITDAAEVAYWIEHHADLIEMKRNQLKLSHELKRIKKEARAA